MELKREDIEIMAPVGSYESLAAAIKNGADSVYFGIENLNMRAHSSNNFTTDDLREIVRQCQEHNIKTYLTVNTVIYDKDVELMHQIVDTAKEVGVSAIIASDVAVMMYARSIGVEVHLSTQLNISNIDALKFYSQFADVSVLARELNMEQVKHIHEEILRQNITGPAGKHIRLEMFCHGALCMAVSGKCYLSLHEHSRSANRGECMQVCRRQYIVKDKEGEIELEVDNECIMSPKDLKTIHFINKMLDSGVRVFKIEGRARGAEYVKTVVSCYNEAINAYLNGEFEGIEENEEKAKAIDSKIEDWNKRLARVFNRGFWNGYYLGQRLGEWTNKYGSQATVKKVYVGKCTNFFTKLGVAEFLIEASDLAVGDEILVTGPTTGAYETTINDLRKGEGEQIEKANKGDYISIATTERLRRNDKLYKWVKTKE
ncbi:MAG: U32 family peptidase [Paludibacteraceae bacterium]|nr:U32 family peptidase [Paludibacteraceae bacterium]MBP5135937.1 U32 family peptidase [Paludibacteraceae bacterium]MBP5742138.1 U32 family peptidase [Paludibacteraceae bacterium]